MMVHSLSRDVKIVSSIRLACKIHLHLNEVNWYVYLQHMTVSLTTINLNKKDILYILISFNAFSTNRNTVWLIYVVTNRPEEPVEKKIGTCAQGSGIISPKINLLTLATAGKKMKGCTT